MRNFLFMHPALLVVMLVLSTSSIGQSRWGFDCRPSLNFPARLFMGSKLEPGLGFDAAVTYNVVGIASVYGGWGWSLFTQNKKKGDAMSVEKMGSNLGVKVTQPLNSYNLGGFVKGGAVYQHIRVEKSTRERYHSGREWGWQVEAGLSLPLDQHIALEPGLKYTNLNGIINQDGSNTNYRLNDISAGIILSIKFGAVARDGNKPRK